MRLYHPYKVADRRPCASPRRSRSRERSCRRSTFVVSIPQPHPKNCIAHPKKAYVLAPHSIYLINQRCADCVCRLVGGDTGMMTGIEIVFFLLYCGLAVALALWASRVRMRSAATPFSTNSSRLSIFLPFFFAGLSAGLSAAAAPLPDPNCPPPASPLEPCRGEAS